MLKGAFMAGGRGRKKSSDPSLEARLKTAVHLKSILEEKI